ncbi:unnamed protein product [Cladocopium goreaui]|uniref:Uncharacterized protein n=1 Tax=Cladocopium goreaui TaxID=2562237 RepID=A0A9P1FXA2_9DINO|nr:unnamed protein product [Cladocopium goreaui]
MAEIWIAVPIFNAAVLWTVLPLGGYYWLVQARYPEIAQQSKTGGEKRILKEQMPHQATAAASGLHQDALKHALCPAWLQHHGWSSADFLIETDHCTEVWGMLSSAKRQLALQTADGQTTAPVVPQPEHPQPESGTGPIDQAAKLLSEILEFAEFVNNELQQLAASLRRATEDFAVQRHQLRQLQRRKEQQKALFRRASAASAACAAAVLAAIEEAQQLLKELLEMREMEQLLRLKERQELELMRLAKASLEGLC